MKSIENQYQRISSGSCEIMGLRSLTGKEECESAALYLDLVDTSATTEQYIGRPYGCIYADNDWLSWYDPNESPYPSALCGENDLDHDYDCICSTMCNILSHTIHR